MNFFDIATILITLSALFGYINHRYLRLPATTGILIVALAGSTLLLGTDDLFPGLRLKAVLASFLSSVDFDQALMHGMLCFLLFAGALHVRFEDLKANRWTIVLLATLGVLLSTALVGGMSFWALKTLGLEPPFLTCLVFGALISPTDPIAVIGLLKELRAPKDLETIIAGESLFNDGVGVVIFFGLTSLVTLEGAGSPFSTNAFHLSWIFLREAGGGVLLGLGMAYLAFRMLKNVNYQQLELLITLALVMFTYAVSFGLGVSGPIAVVVEGLFFGEHGRRYALRPKSAEHVDAFWGMVDDILNAVLFLLIGLEVFETQFSAGILISALVAVPIVLAARYLSVLLPISILQWNKQQKGIVPILTWGGLRGGLSIAMALSLPPMPEKGMILAATFGVVLFSVLVQGLTMRKLLDHYGIVKLKAKRNRA